MSTSRFSVLPLTLIVSTLYFSTAAMADGTCVITCPANMNLATAPGGADVVVNYLVATSGNCGGFVQTAGLPSGLPFSVGTTTNMFRANDPPQQTCGFTVTVTQTPAAPAPIPTLSEWGLMIMSSLLAMGAFFTMRRRN